MTLILAFFVDCLSTSSSDETSEDESCTSIVLEVADLVFGEFLACFFFVVAFVYSNHLVSFAAAIC